MSQLWQLNPYADADVDAKNVSMATRKILFDWLVEVRVQFRLSHSTCALAMHLVDAYQQLSIINPNGVKRVAKRDFQLLGVACYLLASYMKEVSPPTDADWIYISNNAFTEEELIQCTYECIRHLVPFLLMPTEYDVIRQVGPREDGFKTWCNFYIDGPPKHIFRPTTQNLEEASGGLCTEAPEWARLYFSEFEAFFNRWNNQWNDRLWVDFSQPNSVRVGSGSYGEVRRAEEKCVIKQTYVIAWHAGVREAAHLCRLQFCPGIPTLRGWQVRRAFRAPSNNLTAGNFYFQMDYCSCTFHHFVKENRQRMTLAYMQRFLRCIVEVLAYAHTRRIAHRDLSTQNMLTTRSPSQNFHGVKVIDWGMARLVSTHRCLSNTTPNGIGNVWIRPPELICTDLGGTSFHRTDDDVLAGDMWALGCIAVFLCVGPVMARNLNEVKHWSDCVKATGGFSKQTAPRLFMTGIRVPLSVPPQQNGRVVTVFDHLQRISPPLEDLVRGLLQFDPDRRPTAHQVLRHPFFLS